MSSRPAAAPVPAGLRRLTVLIALLSLVVGPLLVLAPGHTAQLFAWTIRPRVTAAALGANFLTALVIELQAARARDIARTRAAYPGMFVYVTAMLLVTLYHRDRFHLHTGDALARTTAWAWFGVYIAVTPVMGWLLARHARALLTARTGRQRALPGWTRAGLAIEGALLLLVGGVLLLAPGQARWLWPWTLTPLTARALATWLLGFGVAAVCGAWVNDTAGSELALVGTAAVGGLQLLVLARFAGALDWSRPQPWLYGACLLALATLGVGSLAVIRGTPRPTDAPLVTTPSAPSAPSAPYDAPA